MIRDEKAFRAELEKANHSWFTEKIEEKERYPIERDEVQLILKDASLKKISMIVGPRRVGKSILIKHIAAELIEKGTKAKNILYYSLEDPYLKLFCDNLIKDTFDYWLENIAGEGDKYVFFDEIHFVDEWYKWLKVIYDRHKDIKIFVSGSSSLALQMEANAYLRGRYIIHEIFPLTFMQFLKLKKRDIDNSELNSFKVDELLDRYKADFRQFLLVGGFPEFLEVRETEKWFQVLKASVSNKAIYEDIAATFKIRNVKILEQILAFIVANQSRILSYEKINEVANLKHEILTNYIEYLKSTYTIIEILKFAKSVKEQLKSQKKFLCMDQGLRNALLKDYEIKEDNEGFIIENVVGVHAYVECLKNDSRIMYYKTNGEADFIIKNKKLAIIEVKYQENISQNDIEKVTEIMKKIGCKEAYIITKNDFRVIKKDGKIVLVPALIFCLYPHKFL